MIWLFTDLSKNLIGDTLVDLVKLITTQAGPNGETRSGQSFAPEMTTFDWDSRTRDYSEVAQEARAICKGKSCNLRVLSTAFSRECKVSRDVTILGTHSEPVYAFREVKSVK